jgi:pimeloyl-ACP methyl ester carboxylesterase
MRLSLVITFMATMAGGTHFSMSPWLTLPPTPELPPSHHEAYAHVNNISLWFALYGPLPGTPHAGPPVVLLHGGKISSRWYSHLITNLAPTYTVIAIDTRAHGRSTDDLSVALSYDQFARDAISLLDILSVSNASFVGWSDGANTALALSMNYPSRVNRIIAFGANFNPNQANITGIEQMPFLNDLLNREKSEYNELHPDPNWDLFSSRVGQMQSVAPMWNQSDFDRIPILGLTEPAPMILCADGDHEEVVTRSTVFEIHEMVLLYF